MIENYLKIFCEKQGLLLYLQPKIAKTGELAEWLNAAVLKTVKDASPSGVRIPDSPPPPPTPHTDRSNFEVVWRGWGKRKFISNIQV
jgi:hypothetical protein